jgi:FixJ family two-component response regulator
VDLSSIVRNRTAGICGLCSNFDQRSKVTHSAGPLALGATIPNGGIEVMISMPTVALPPLAKPNAEARSCMHRCGDEKIVIVIDSDDEMRTALALALESPGRIIRPFCSAEEFLAANLNHNRPTCVVSEVRLRALSGLGLQKRLQSDGQRVPLIFLSGSTDIAVAVQAIRAGGFDYLEKPIHRQLLLERIERALDEDARLLQEDEKKRQFQSHIAALSRRQQDVYWLLMRGKSNKQIAAELQIGLPTVTRHRAKILAKFGVSNPFRLMTRATELGMAVHP